ncbi:MAG: hypothetical protein ACYTE5_05540 [Planctomycetota bacterium]|jgi:hypothetical protein
MHCKKADTIKNRPLSNDELRVINGCLLGDGTLTVSGKNFRIRIEHSLAQQEYVMWKYGRLKSLTITSPKVVSAHRSIRFGTVGHPYITQLRRQWYDRGRKKLPENFDLDEFMLSIWFMDDGCRHRDTVDISVHNFDMKDISKLQVLLKQKGVGSTVNSDQKGYRLYILKDSYSVFKRLVKPYMIKCMAYKLP